MRSLNSLSNFRWFTTVILLITLGIGQMWGTETICKTLDFSDSDFRSGNGTTSQTTTWTATKSTTTWSIYGFHNNNWNSSWTKIRAGSKKSKAGDAAKTGTGTISTSFSCSEAITKVVVTTASCAATSDRKLTGTKIVLASNSTFTENVVEYTGPTTATSNEMTFTVTTPTANRYYKLSFTWYNNTTSTAEVIEVSKVEYYYQEASCSANPSIGDASLNGSFSLSTVGVQCASITPGSNCSVASGDYGFIWYANDGTKKEIGGTGVTKVAVTSGAYSSGSFSANLTSTFVLGNRYSVRAFATNGKPATAYSDTITFQPRSVTFNLNGHGSSTPTTQYVNNGGKATDPSYSESVTGYTFGGWYKEAGCSNSWTFGTDVVSGANKTLYAKWTAKTYTIDLDQDLTPTSAGTTSISVTYNANTNLTSAITKPTKTGWTFAGYYTAKNGGGTQIIDAGGNVLASKAGYTDASKNWIGTSDVTLYAKWTCTVTWSVNNLTNVYSAQTLTYNASSTKVASVPGPPSPATYCGDKFMGWTTESDVSQDDDTGLNLFTNVAGSPELKTVGNITFYAVFADYDE